MKLQELKEETLGWWRHITEMRSFEPIVADFKTDVRKFGDLRYKSTWIKAHGAYFVEGVMQSMEGWNGIRDCLWCDHPSTKEYFDDILEAFLQHPDGLEFLRTGLEQLYALNGPGDREIAFKTVERLFSIQPVDLDLPLLIDV